MYFVSLSVCAALLLISNRIMAGEVSGQIKLLQQSVDKKETPAANSAGIIVYITGFDEATSAAKPKLFLRQENKMFVPRVSAVTVGDTVTFQNKDDIFHHTWSASPAKAFDLGQYKKPEEKTVTFDKPGLISIFCNVHPQMIASILVLKNNKYFITGANGEYKITGIPAGHHQLRIWSEGVDPTVKPIVVTESSKEKLDFTVQQKLRAINHPNKDGKPYEKYN